MNIEKTIKRLKNLRYAIDTLVEALDEQEEIKHGDELEFMGKKVLVRDYVPDNELWFVGEPQQPKESSSYTACYKCGKSVGKDCECDKQPEEQEEKVEIGSGPITENPEVTKISIGEAIGAGMEAIDAIKNYYKEGTPERNVVQNAIDRINEQWRKEDQPEEPTLWDEFDKELDQLQDNDGYISRESVKSWLKSKLLELAEEYLRMEEQIRTYDAGEELEAWADGYDNAVKEINKNLDTFISKLNG